MLFAYECIIQLRLVACKWIKLNGANIAHIIRCQVFFTVGIFMRLQLSHTRMCCDGVVCALSRRFERARRKGKHENKKKEFKLPHVDIWFRANTGLLSVSFSMQAYLPLDSPQQFQFVGFYLFFFPSSSFWSKTFLESGKNQHEFQHVMRCHCCCCCSTLLRHFADGAAFDRWYRIDRKYYI